MSTLLFIGLAIGGASLYLENTSIRLGELVVSTNYLEVVLIVLIVVEIISRLGAARWRTVFLRRRFALMLSAAALLVLLVASKFTSGRLFGFSLDRSVVLLFVLRNIVALGVSLRRVKGLSDFLDYLREHPAQTIVLSFFLVILSGTVLLMMPFTSSGTHGLSFVNALFTSTSAVCVTGLTVVNTATAFSLSGKVVVLLLIQIGGLGIMILTFFTIFVLRRAISVENKLLISFMLSEDDMTRLRGTVVRIIEITFLIEGIGAALLFVGFSHTYGPGGRAAFYAVFHSISAFCNAGFALYGNSLVRYVGNPWISGTIAGLIILGGLSFVVIINLEQNLSDRLLRAFGRKSKRVQKLSLNTRVVLATTGVLIVSGTLIIYATEHGNALRSLPLGTQYLAAFFQSVTLRTAGFNTIPFGSLRAVTYLVMIAYMFIGGASGSTAGGIKIGTVAVIYAYLSAFFRNRKRPVLFQQSISDRQVTRAFTIFLFGIVVVGLATTLLSVTEREPTLKLLFEATSAFGTVGLSTGITSSLSIFGRLLISALMFTGRIGTLTVLAAASREEEPGRIAYPEGEISIG